MTKLFDISIFSESKGALECIANILQAATEYPIIGKKVYPGAVSASRSDCREMILTRQSLGRNADRGRLFAVDPMTTKDQSN